VLYNLALLLLGICTLPKLFWDWVRHHKYRASLGERLGFKLPQIPERQGHPRIWIHSISMGETKAVIPLVRKIQSEMPEALFYFSTTTETGQQEAKKSLSNLEACFFLPIDFSWIVKKLVSHVKPDILILVESDFWYNLLQAVPKAVVVNGKISETSFKRFRRVPRFARKLFSRLSLFCLQSERYRDRFLQLGADVEKIVVTGNLKFDQPIHKIDQVAFKQELGIDGPVVTLASTHAPEEEELLSALEAAVIKFPNLKIVVVPRHPERFEAVAGLLEKKGISFYRYSDRTAQKGNERVILINAMGVLNACYQISDVAIVAGSFGSLVGGHNIFEPAALGIPTLFGPHMESQHDLVDLVVSAGAGRQVELDNLASQVCEILSNPSTQMHTAGLKLAQEMYGSTDRTWDALRSTLCNF